MKIHHSHDGYEIKPESDGNETCNLDGVTGCGGWQEGIDSDRRDGRRDARVY